MPSPRGGLIAGSDGKGGNIFGHTLRIHTV
jgi:hypothetical protein